ncbi:MAG: thiamine diphosphokinase [Coxiellaceae bacterium]|jgi:thiamine pyrophosphokinase|nr:thiamine diphosphokinase [Coxiellaceae bacterium]
MKVIIIAGGIPPSKKLILQEKDLTSIIIAADSGANCLQQYNIIPNLIIGDCDSIDRKVLEFWSNKNITIERFSPEKNLTDTELAFKKATIFLPEKITFLGCLSGKRIDHLLGSIGLLEKCLQQNINACLKDDYQTITLLKETTVIYGNRGQLFSLHAYGGNVKNLSITGCKYHLNKYLLKTGDALTISNRFEDTAVNIQFTTGKLLVIIEN